MGRIIGIFVSRIIDISVGGVISGFVNEVIDSSVGEKTKVVL